MMHSAMQQPLLYKVPFSNKLKLAFIVWMRKQAATETAIEVHLFNNEGMILKFW